MNRTHLFAIAGCFLILLTICAFAIKAKQAGQPTETNIILGYESSKEDESLLPFDSRVWLEGTKGWAQAGDSLFPVNSNWWVGVGTSSPDEMLDVRGSILGHGLNGSINGISSLNMAGVFGVTGLSVGSAAGYGAVSGFMSSTSSSHSGVYARVYENATGLHVQRITGSGDIARFIGTGALNAMIIQNDGDVGIGTDSPSYDLHVVGDIYCTGKLTSVGGNDPPYVLYDNESRRSIIDRVREEVPVEKQNGAVLFWNGEDSRFEVYLPSKGEFRDLLGNTLLVL